MTAGRPSLEEVADRMGIDDTLTRYTRAIDTMTLDWLDDVFTPDADIDYSASGGIAGKYPEVKDWLGKALSAFSVFQHFIGNTTYEISGDEANTRTYFVNPMLFENPDGGKHVFTIYGYYVDRLVRTDVGWRIARRVEEQAVLDGSLPGALEIPE
jgi:hypothetical protein